MARIRLRDFSAGLWLSGGREYGPSVNGEPISLRRAEGVNPLKTVTLRSRAGSQLVLASQDAHSLYRFAGNRYAGVGTTLIDGDVGTVLRTGLSGDRLSFAKMPPQQGDKDYLFVADGANPFKIDEDGNVTNWGIQPPPDGFIASAGTRKTRLIDDMNGTAGTYTVRAPYFEVRHRDDDTLDGNNLLLSFSGAGGWTLRKALAIDLSTYADTTISLPTDAIAITLLAEGRGFVNWGLTFAFDVGDGTFRHDYFIADVAFLATPAFGFDYQKVFGLGTLVDLKIPKSAFRRIGDNGKSWESVNHISIQHLAMSASAADYGNSPGSTDHFGATLALQNWELEGGYPLSGNYQYAVTFRNTKTGSRSNSNPNYVNVSGVDRAPVALKNLPVSSDAQVDAREIWRSIGVLPGTAFSDTLFLVALIPDNTTTIYNDSTIADVAIPYTINVWRAGLIVPLGFYVDGGNGYYFKATTAGTTGANVPNWNVPNIATWAASYPFVVGNTLVPIHGNPSHNEFRVSAISGTKLSAATEPHWDGVAVGATVTDGGITWLNLGPLTTADNTAVWTLQGVNALETIQPVQLPVDNAPPALTTFRCAGPYEDIMFSVNSDHPGRLYYSPPGRPESIAGFVWCSDVDDPLQMPLIYNNNAFIWSEKNIHKVSFISATVEGGLTFVVLQHSIVESAPGTTDPFSVIESNQVVVYRSMEGLMRFDGVTAVPFGMDALGLLFRGEDVENLKAMSIACATYHDGEYICSDAANQTLAIDIYNNRWRSLGVPVKAIFTELDTHSLLASLAGDIVLLEQPSKILDVTEPIAFEWQPSSVRLATSQQAVLKRLYIDCDPKGAIITPTLILDNQTIALPPFTGTSRKNPPYEWTLGLTGQLAMVRLNGSVADGIVELFGIEFEVDAGVKD